MAAQLKGITALAATAALLLAAPALADESSLQGYGGIGGNVQTEITQGAPSASKPSAPPTQGAQPATPARGGAGPTTAQTTGGGGLPFTGSDLGLLTGVGLLLIASGAGLRRLSERRNRG
jgi:hypothetical protein